MRKNYYAYTGLASHMPEYISVNKEEDGTISVSVGTKGNNTGSVIFLTPEQAEHMATDIIANLNGFE